MLVLPDAAARPRPGSPGPAPSGSGRRRCATLPARRAPEPGRAARSRVSTTPATASVQPGQLRLLCPRPAMNRLGTSGTSSRTMTAGPNATPGETPIPRTTDRSFLLTDLSRIPRATSATSASTAATSSGPSARNSDRAAALGREHHDPHDALAVHRHAVLARFRCPPESRWRASRSWPRGGRADRAGFTIVASRSIMAVPRRGGRRDRWQPGRNAPR